MPPPNSGLAPPSAGLPLDARIAEGLRRAREQFPDLQLDDARAVAFVSAALAGAEDALAGDLFLVGACLAGDRRAHEHLDALLCSPPLLKLARRFEVTGLSPGEVIQKLREKLLLPSAESGPKLEQYAGRGPLFSWLRACLVRTGQDLHKRRGLASRMVDENTDLEMLATDPELRWMRAEHAQEIRAALRFAVQQLEPRSGNVLRLHLLEGATLDALAVSYNVHRATIARWIADARCMLFQLTRERLASRLNLSESGVNSLLNVLDSQFSASLGRWLHERAEESR